MTRTKWLRLGVRDPADILRWAAAQNTRALDDLRHRVIGGREFVSFRMVPRYRVQVGADDILVVAHVKMGLRQQLAAGVVALRRKATRRVAAAIATLRPAATPLPPRSAELYQFAKARLSRSSR